MFDSQISHVYDLKKKKEKGIEMDWMLVDVNLHFMVQQRARTINAGENGLLVFSLHEILFESQILKTIFPINIFTFELPIYLCSKIHCAFVFIWTQNNFTPPLKSCIKPHIYNHTEEII